MFELIVNVLLFLFLGYTMCFHVLEAVVPAKVAKNPYNLQPDVWPKAIIILLLICLAINIYRIIKKNKGNPDFNFAAFGKNCAEFLKSKMFLGMVIIVAASLILETLGFIVTAFLLLFFYGMLLGEKNIVRLLIVCVVVTFLLYIVFSVLLSVNLPRGTIPFLRNFALSLEGIFH